MKVTDRISFLFNMDTVRSNLQVNQGISQCLAFMRPASQLSTQYKIKPWTDLILASTILNFTTEHLTADGGHYSVLYCSRMLAFAFHFRL